MLKAALGAAAPMARPVHRALLSVSDKRGVVELGSMLSSFGVELLSTGGTAKALRDAGLPITDVSDFTGAPEMMGGRVKTLHPKVHGGILAVRGNADHEADMATHGVKPIDMVVMNLYPFEDAVATGGSFDTCIENIDIGGPTMLRAAAKNHASVAVLSSPDQYAAVMDELREQNGAVSADTRRRLASDAFRLSADYDTAISSWFGGQLDEGTGAGAGAAAAAGDAAAAAAPHTRTYTPDRALKYGNNPHQHPAFVGRIGDGRMPFRVLNGTPGYINLLDALNAWHLVRELRDAVGLPAAASFKHVSPAGAAVAVPLDDVLTDAYEAAGRELTPTALAYLRARNADPMCSFGDFAAVSDVVDAATARCLKPEVSDGIIAPGYEPEALDILRSKKGGNFIVLEADPAFEPPDMEFRELYGVSLAQHRNDALLTPAVIRGDGRVPTAATTLPDAAVRDLLVASIAVKYTQSNSVAFAVDGQVVGVGAGQQSRVDCVKLAGRKVQTWHLRRHDKVRGLKFRAGVKRTERVNARVRYIEGDFTEVERRAWAALFEEEPEPLTDADKAAWMAGLTGVGLSSDAFFPFRDGIDVASRFGVQYIAQPGGSVGDAAVVSACDEYGMTMAMTGLRLFHH